MTVPDTVYNLEKAMKIRCYSASPYLHCMSTVYVCITTSRGASSASHQLLYLHVFCEISTKMLILIAGVTGMVGQACAQAAFSAGHRVRGLARNPEKLDKTVLGKLEGFIKMKNIYDIPKLDEAAQGVDAIISAIHFTPESVLEGQLLLLRAAERAHVKVKLCSSGWIGVFSFDKIHRYSMRLPGTTTGRNCNLATARAMTLISPFTTISVLVLPSSPSIASQEVIVDFIFDKASHSNPVNENAKTLSFYGTGNETWTFTALDDLATYTIQAVSEPDAARGGYYYVDSFRCTTFELGRAYEDVHGIHLKPVCLGSIDDLDRKVERARMSFGPQRYLEYIGWVYMKLQFTGVLDYESVDSLRWSHIKQTGLREWFENHGGDWRLAPN